MSRDRSVVVEAERPGLVFGCSGIERKRRRRFTNPHNAVMCWQLIVRGDTPPAAPVWRVDRYVHAWRQMHSGKQPEGRDVFRRVVKKALLCSNDGIERGRHDCFISPARAAAPIAQGGRHGDHQRHRDNSDCGVAAREEFLQRHPVLRRRRRRAARGTRHCTLGFARMRRRSMLGVQRQIATRHKPWPRLAGPVGRSRQRAIEHNALHRAIRQRA